jgi:hypothetical protein
LELYQGDEGRFVSIRTGAEYKERLKDGRTVYVNGDRVKDVTTYPSFQRTVDTEPRSMTSNMTRLTRSY